MGKALAVTGHILGLAGEAGVPVIGLVGTALKIGADLLSEDQGYDGHQEVIASNTEVKKIVQKSFKEISKTMDIVTKEINEVKVVAYKTLDLASGLRYKAGVENIDADFETLMDGANNLEITLGLFDNYIIELQTNAKQHLNPEKIGEYFCLLNSLKEYEKCASFFTYVVAIRAKYLHMMSVYYIYKGDTERVQNEFESFNSDCKLLAKKLLQSIGKKSKPELAKVEKFSSSLIRAEFEATVQRKETDKKEIGCVIKEEFEQSVERKAHNMKEISSPSVDKKDSFAVRQVKAIYDFDAEIDTGAISIKTGEVLTLSLRTEVENGWWVGWRENGEYGYFPEAYVEEIPP